MTQSADRTIVDIYVDPSCPFAWQTSRWLREVEKLRPIELRWRILSLGALNENRDVPDEYRQVLTRTWAPVRLLVAARDQHGDDIVGPLYEAIGNHFHPGGRREEQRAVLEEALAEVGLPAELIDAADDTSFDDAVRAVHAEAMAAYGDDMGTPLIAIDGLCFFGPVIAKVQRGEAAAEMWDHVVALAKTPGFYELKRRRDADLDFS